MPRLLASYPLFWILTIGTSSDAGPAELLFGLLESDGAARISLGPLDHEAQLALIGDVLCAVPDQTLIELAADAAGNPLVLAGAFRGLRDENAIVVRDGHASLALAQVSSAQVTSRIETLARDRLKGLSARARRFVATASILGGSFRLEDVGEMLGESPGALLAALDEALSAYLLVVRAEGLTFRHEFVRQAVARMLAEPVQQALHWQYGRMLLARGGSAVPAAYHLLRGARPGDAEALAGLDRAVADGHYYPSPFLTDGVLLVEAQVLEARRGPQAALDFLADVLAGLPEHRSMLLTDPASAPWLVRVALAAGDHEQAARIVTAICEVARGNPTLAFIRASAEHAEGLLTSDVSLQQHASAQLPDPWARARWRTRACCWPRRAGTARRSAAWRSPSGSTTGSGRAPADGCAGSGCGARTGRVSRGRPRAGPALPTSSRPRPAWWPKA